MPNNATRHREEYPVRKPLLLSTALAVAIAGTAQAQDDAEPRIGYVLHVTGNPFIKQIFDHALQAGDDLGVEVVTAGPQAFDAEAQLKDVQDLHAAGVDAIVTSVSRANPWSAPSTSWSIRASRWSR